MKLKIQEQIKKSSNATNPEKLSYSSYFVGQNIIYNLINTGLMVYWTAVIGISGTIAGLIMMLSRFWDAINDPMMAGIINKTGKRRFGLYKPWVFVSAFTMPVMLVLVFSAPFNIGNSAPQIVWATITYFIFWMVYTVADVPLFAMSVTMEPDVKKRTKLLLLGRLAAAFAGIIVAVFYNYVLKFHKTIEMFLIMAIALGILSMILMIPIFIIRERNIIKDMPKITIKQMFKSVFRNKYLLRLLLAMTTTYLFLGTTVFQGYIFAEGGYINTSEAVAIVITVLSSVVGFLFTIVVSRSLIKLGSRKTMLIMEVAGMVLILIGCITTRYYRNIGTYFVMTLGTSLTILTPSVISRGKLGLDCIEYSQYHNGVRDETTIFATQTFVSKFVGGISSFIIGAITTGLGYNSIAAAKKENQADGVIDKLVWALMVAMLIMGVLNIIFYTFVYNLRSKDVKIMSAANRNQITKEQAAKELAKPFRERDLANIVPVVNVSKKPQKGNLKE